MSKPRLRDHAISALYAWIGDHLDALLRDSGEALKELLLIGHSMGGLVVRSACHQGREESWVDRIDHIFYLGSPHLGAPLEKVANVVTSVLGGVDATATRVNSDLLKTPSRGGKDFRYGTLLDQEGWDHDPLALARHPAVYEAIARRLSDDEE